MSILEMLRGRREKKSKDAIELAKMVARGEAVDPDLIIQAMIPAGLDDEGFAALVDLFERRGALRRRAALLESAEREVGTIRSKIDAADAALAEARRRHDEAVRPLLEVLSVAEGRLHDASSARSELTSDHNLPRELAKRRQAARNHLEKSMNEHQRRKDALKIAVDWVKDSEAKLAEYKGGVAKAVSDFTAGLLYQANGDGLAASRLVKYRNEVNRIQPTVESAAAEVADAKAVLDAIEQEIASL
jgi:chromosome segregation ATPase